MPTVVVILATGVQRQVNLRSALHSIYIGVLKSLVTSCADAVMGNSSSDQEPPAWIAVYRAAFQAADVSGLQDVDTSRFPGPIGEFASGFTKLHKYRDIMEMEPDVIVSVQEVSDAMALAEEAMGLLEASEADQVRAFAVKVTLSR